MNLKYKRVLIKLSGEALRGDSDKVLDFNIVNSIASAIKQCMDIGAEVAVLVGGGNIWRGAKGVGMNRSRADHMGMLATMINALALHDSLERIGLDAVTMSSVEMEAFAETFVRDNAVRYLKQGSVVILGGGIGNPYFTTDTAAVIRAAELGVDIAILAKNVDAIYDKDPKIYSDAKPLEYVNYEYIIEKKLGVIDIAAAALSSENNIPLLICALEDPTNIVRAVTGEKIGTEVRHKD